MSIIGIITIQSKNLGNRLQNYALQFMLDKLGVNAITIKRKYYYTKKEKNKTIMSKLVSPIYKIDYYKFFPYKIAQKINKLERTYNYEMFNKNYINLSNFYDEELNEKNDKKINGYIVGSDQVWNPEFNMLTGIDLLNFTSNEKKFSYAASFGISQLPEYSKDMFKTQLSLFKKLSVREKAGKLIINKLMNREDVIVHPDPTLLIKKEEWDMLAEKPLYLKKKKYILTYFLGDLDQELLLKIKKVAIEYDCEIIELLNKNNKFYSVGPKEFLFLEKNAFLICTDSFHSSVFAFIFDVPFIVFDRKQKGKSSMNSRIESFLETYYLKDRKISMENDIREYINHDYSLGYIELKKQRKQALLYLEDICEDLKNGQNRKN